MQYLLLIYEDEKVAKDMTPEEMQAVIAEYGTFTEGIVKSGHFKGGEALEPVDTATTVRVRDGKTVKTDGPFAETREQLGGYYLIQAPDLDEACSIAAKIPAARNGSIEIRPIMTFD
ncbi:MAG TPA: hypothetical protein DEF51_39500 [Myxococcales bacterium]|nr:hypothetical protein [Myxococcales bacterium]